MKQPTAAPGRKTGDPPASDDEPWTSKPGAWPPVGEAIWPAVSDPDKDTTSEAQRSDTAPKPGPAGPFDADFGHDDIWSDTTDGHETAAEEPRAKKLDPEIEAAASMLAADAPAVEPSDSARPPTLAKPPPAPDDLKKVKGIGTTFEVKLNALGIYQYSQLAAWTPDQQRWVGETLGFVGRVERDGWTEQAAALAKGGSTREGV